MSKTSKLRRDRLSVPYKKRLDQAWIWVLHFVMYLGADLDSDPDQSNDVLCRFVHGQRKLYLLQDMPYLACNSTILVLGES